MLKLIEAYYKSIAWKRRVRILLSNGWTNADRSTLASDHVFWTDKVHTLHYRASFLADLPFDKFYNLVRNNNLSSC